MLSLFREEMTSKDYYFDSYGELTYVIIVLQIVFAQPISKLFWGMPYYQTFYHHPPRVSAKAKKGDLGPY